jgi:hypothetical protein
MKSQQRIDQRGFSGAVGTEQADGVPLQLSCEPIEHGAASQPDLQSIKINHAHVTLLRFEKPACSRNLIKVPRVKKSKPKRWLSLAASIRLSLPQAHMVVGRASAASCRMVSADSPLSCESSGVKTGPRF